MRWQQPSRGPDGETVLREMEHACVNGCGGRWKHPAAESSAIVDSPAGQLAPQDSVPATRQQGLADEANAIGSDFITEYVRSRGFKWGN
ncbi:MAG TPA: hypothetical protein VFW65_35150 [Pseudonocardiaceae bacterium]|nr:hypothetical protein [Pseudonocardiaceae bacterium]